MGLVSELLGPVIDKIVPDAGQRKEMKLRAQELEQKGEFREDEMRLEAIMAEAESEDPWTSRARPSFLYVIYFLMLSSIPFAIFFAFEPESAKQVVEGFKLWLEAIPGEFLTLFGAGYLGYTGFRSMDKRQKEKLKQQAQKQGFFKKLFNNE